MWQKIINLYKKDDKDKYEKKGFDLYINDYINSLEIQLEDLNSESIIIGDNINEIQINNKVAHGLDCGPFL